MMAELAKLKAEQEALKAAKAQLDHPRTSMTGAAIDAPVTPNIF